ncbi:MAG: hypothetical protein JSV80_17175 [Acidobacteriota bacterium]|nr:MAG: hypothetical protein JSV80_17175 [Acidobacteriota bacterium]
MRGESGRGKVGLFIWIGIMAAAVFVAYRTVPVRVAVMKLHDFADEQTRFAAVTGRYDERKLVHDIVQRAHELGLPLNPKQIKIEERPNVFRLLLKHEVSVNLELYMWNWRYDEAFEHIRL